MKTGKTLITGGAGFIGSELAGRIASDTHLCILDNLRTGERGNLEKLDIEFREGSITSFNEVQAAVDGCDTVYHLAAMVGVAESVANPRLCAELNVVGLLNVLEASLRAGVKKFVFASSAAVYGDTFDGPRRETDPPSPRSPYAVTKLDGELYCEIYAREHGLESACLRFFNVFGPKQKQGGSYGAVVPAFITRALEGEPLVINGDGAQTRDFIHVSDVTSALRFASRRGITGILNVGYGQPVSIDYLAKQIVFLCRSNSSVKHDLARPGDVRHSYANVQKIISLGWAPELGFGAGLSQTIESYSNSRSVSNRGFLDLS